jgi:hypothetical protein
MAAIDDHGSKRWNFFDTRKDLTAHVDWLNSPSEDKPLN